MKDAQGSSPFRITHVFCCVLAGLLILPGAARGGDAETGAPGIAAASNVLRFDNPSYSPDGKWIAMSDGLRDALYLYSVVDKTILEIANSPSGGYAFNWAADGTKLGFKLLVPNGDTAFPLQIPVFYDVARQTLVSLGPAGPRVGVPSFSAKGAIAFTVDRELRIVDEAGKTIKTFTLDNYANLTPISPDGTRVAYNDRDDRICVIDLATGEKTLLTADENGYFNPVWSPDSTRLTVSTVSGRLKVIEPATGRSYELGAGVTPSWASDSRTVFFTRVDRIDGIRVNRADICQVQFDGSGLATLTQDMAMPVTAARASADGGKIAFVSLTDGELYETPLSKADAALQTEGTAQADSPASASSRYTLGPAVKISSGAVFVKKAASAAPVMQADDEKLGPPITPAVETTVSKTVPYLHQVYDTADSFNGNWACNATSAVMCLAYCEVVPHWDMTCCCPSSHTSHYGQYISAIYTNNGHTYNIGSADPNGHLGYGGYGYIVRNNWADTKGYMRDYLNNHGVPSSVDWSPTFTKLQSEVNAQHPFVVLNMLTSAGHYIVAIGYVDGQHTGIFNDPYGNKNSGYMNYSGAGVRYDWPGYNNGYQNLNSAECFIYARYDFPESWAASYRAQSYPSTMTAGSTAVAWAEFTNNGSGHWTHCATKLGTSSPHDRTSPFCTPANWACADGSHAGCTRPTDVDQSDVARGAVGRFTFIVTAPSTPGTYTEKFQLVQEGVAWFGPEITWTITVTASQGTLTGTVRNASNSAAIAGATVTATGVGTTTTNSSGVYTFSNVNAGTYSMSVTATGFNATSGSATVTAGQTTTKDFSLTPSDTQAPTTPTNLTAEATGSTTVQLSWTASTDNVGVAGYDIRRNGNIVGSSTGTSYTDSGATPATTFTYEVRAKDAVPNYSGWSASASATTPPAPPQLTTVFSDGFNGNMNNWTQSATPYSYSTAANRGGLTGTGAAYYAAGGSAQMYHPFARPFAQGTVSGYFFDGKGGWKPSVCGWAYRQCLSLRDPNGAAKMYIDNEIYNSPDNSKYYYRLIGGGGGTHTTYATRDAATDCNGTWVRFETTMTPGAGSTGTVLLKVTDRAGTSTATMNATTDFFDWGIGRITLGQGISSANEGYWDDVTFQAMPPDWPTMDAPSGISATGIQWNFSPRDNNYFGWDVADGGGAILAPQYPNSGWLSRSATSWAEGGLTPNTEYTRKVRAWNGTLNSAFSLTASAYTLSVAPASGSVTPDNGSVCTGDNVVWTAVGGFGAGKVAYYKYAWDQSATHAFTGSEPTWSGGTIATQATAAGAWYLHVQGFNGANVANGTYDYALPAGAQPVITQQPAAQNVCLGATVQFAVAAAGEGTIAYQWQRDGAAMTNGGDVSGVDTPMVQLANLTGDDAGSYRCLVTAECGTAASEAVALTFKAATTITQQPASLGVPAGTAVIFTVAAVGDGALTYQWQKDGVDIAEAASATLQIAHAGVGDRGNYRCVVTAGCGSAVSDEAILAVTSYAADLDSDNDVDLDDFAFFRGCFNGPNRQPAFGCLVNADFDNDNDVDLDDFTGFRSCFNGANRPVACP